MLNEQCVSIKSVFSNIIHRPIPFMTLHLLLKISLSIKDNLTIPFPFHNLVHPISLTAQFCHLVNNLAYSKLTYSSFLYYTDKQKNLCRYKEERDFTESEYKYSVQKKKEASAPAGGGGVSTLAKMEDM